MSKNRLFSILTIICFITVLFIPVGVVLMIYYTNWKKKLKIILSSTLSTFYILLIAFILIAKPSFNINGISLPFGSNSGYTAFETTTNSKNTSKINNKSKNKNKNNDNIQDFDIHEEQVPKKIQKNEKGKPGRLFYSILFFLFMLFLIIWQNIKNKNKTDYENPYVDTNKYKLPLTDDAKMPLVHFLRIKLRQNEKINFATETTQKNNEGDFVITNQRVVILNKSENVEFPLDVLEAVSSATNSVMVLTSGERKYYIFMSENQMKYALAVLRWTVKKFQENN